MTKTFDFAEQLKSGNKGEELFLKTHPDIIRLDGRRGDFMGNTGRKIELKTESRPSTSPNIFLERYSSIETKNPGGCWQALEHDAHYLVYLFGDWVAWWFPVKPLVKFMDLYLIEKTPFMHVIRNKGWSGGGYAVPKKDLRHLIELEEVLK